MRWEIETLDFRQGDNRLTAAGRVSEAAIDLAGELDFPALANLHEALSGTLAGAFSAGGSLEAPQIELSLAGDRLAFAEHRLEPLRLDASVTVIEDPSLAVGLDRKSTRLN